MAISGLERSRKDILGLFAKSAGKVYLKSDINSLLRDNRAEWRLPQRFTFTDFVEFLKTEGKLRLVTLRSESAYGPKKRYVWGDASPFALALSLRKDSYLTHSTAVFLHGLTDQIPQTIYVNAEQSPKPHPSGKLTQESLDRAFRAHQRSSRYVFIHERSRIVVLSGKNTGHYGVIALSPTAALDLRTTTVERTLIDITVRPTYGGGVHEVLVAFREALAHVSFSKLLATLKVLDYVYPYHQALGFYLERAGASKKRLDRLRSLGLEHDFYLAHGHQDPAFDSSWRIYYPKGL